MLRTTAEASSGCGMLAELSLLSPEAAAAVCNL